MQEMTLENLNLAVDPWFEVDVIIRKNGRLIKCVQFCNFMEAQQLAEKYLKLGYAVSMEESNGSADF